jgi:hypothetical protein
MRCLQTKNKQRIVNSSAYLVPFLIGFYSFNEKSASRAV